MDRHYVGWDDDACTACRHDLHRFCDPVSNYCECSKGWCWARLYVERLAEKHGLPPQTFHDPRGNR